jgi:predicted chitinase
MDYQKAKNIRGKKFSELMTDKLLEGQSIGSSLSKTLSERSKARFTGIKQFFDPLNIAKAVTGGSRLGPAILGKMTGASQERMSFFAGDPKKKKIDALTTSGVNPESLSMASQSLGNIYGLLKQDMEDKKLQKEQLQSREEEQESEEEKRNQELIKALTARIKPKAKKKKEDREIKRESETKAPTPPALKKPVVAKPPAAPTPTKPPTPTPAPPAPTPAPPAPTPAPPKPTAVPAPKVPPAVTTAKKVAKGVAITGAIASGVGLVTAALTSAGLSKKAQANVLSQVESESNFKPRNENLNYTSAERIQKTFGKGRIPSTEYAQTLVGNPEKLAEAVYGKDTAAGKALGNTEPGDGWKYRGRGFLQHTGKGQYIEIKKYTGIDVVSNPDLLNDPEVAAKAIPWFFLSYKGLKPADLENISTVNRAVGFSDPTGQKAAARAELASKYESRDLSVPAAPAASSTGTQIDSASKENKDLKESLNKDKSKQTVVNNTTVTSESENTTQTPETVVDDRPALLKKKG